jgi:oligopeptide transport system substrate-binding protein
MRRPLGLALALLGGCSLPPGEWFGEVAERPDPGHFRICNNGEPETLDPTLSTSTTDVRIVSELFDGLTTHDGQGHPVPSLATHWDTSTDQRRHLFHLRADARWSNGRRLDAHDFVWQMARALHPATASPRADIMWKVLNAQAYTSGRAHLVLARSGPFEPGDVVDVLPLADGENPPAPSERVARERIPLRLEPDAGGVAHATLPAGAEVTIMELGGDGRAWAWVYWMEGEGKMGWVPLATLDAPHAGRSYLVQRLPRPFTAPRDALPVVVGVMQGKDLLLVPEVLGVRAPDRARFEVELADPTPYFLELTLQPAFRPTPREAIARNPRRWFRPGAIVTSGPFHLTYWRERDKFELVRSPTFWGAAKIRLERVTILSMNDTSASAATYYRGGCDHVVSNNLPVAWLPVLDGSAAGATRRKDFVLAPYLGIYFFLVNTEKVQSVHLRRALSAALDRSELPALLKAGQIPTDQFTPGVPSAQLTPEQRVLCGVTADTPGVSLMVTDEVCYTPPRGTGFDEDLARRELALARAELGDRFPKSLTFRFNTGVEFHKDIAEWAQARWRRVLGLDVQLESQEWKTYLAATRQRDYEIARLGNIGNFPDPEAEFLRVFKCDSPDNRTAFCDPEFERLFAAAAREPDRKTRLALVRQAEAVVMAGQPVIPLFVYTQYVLTKPYVRGLPITVIGYQTLREVWIDVDWKTRAVE